MYQQVIAAGLVVFLAAPSSAPTPARSPSAVTAPSVLAGTWTLTRADEIRPDGEIVEPYGADATGLLMIDSSGRYSLQIFRQHRPRFAAGDKRRGTAAEFEAAVLGTSAHVGRCSVEPATGTLTFSIEHAAYPNWEGTVQKRKYLLNGDTLSYEIPASATGDGTIPRSFWKRLR
jgi:hypothetical protein